MTAHTIHRRRALLLALVAGLLVVALGALTASAATVTVTPGNPQGWVTFGNSGGGSSAITTTAPRSGDGSVEMTGDRTRWIKAVDPLAPAKLGDLYDVTDFAFDWMVAVGSTSSLGPNYTPALRLHVYDPNAANPYSELIWEGAYNGPVVVTQGSWVSTDMVGGSQLLWRWVTGVGVTLDGGGAQVNQTLGDWQDTAWYSTDAVVFGISVGVGSSVGAGYHAHADNLVLGFAGAPDTFNFEPNPQCTTVCYVDDTGSDANGGTSPADAKKTIQAAIDQVSAGGQVRVLPGSYDETATNRTVLDGTPLANGPHQFGLFIAHTVKDGISIIGVTAADVEITDPNATEADITTNATNNFGYSGIFVEADDVTIAGLEIGPNTPGENKTIEVIGDNFTLKNSKITGDGVDGGSPYVNDWRYDDITDTAHVERYTFDNNVFGAGSILTIASGAGGSGPVSGRQITDNVFSMGAGQNWPSISFNGHTTTVPWYTYPVGGAIITGNTFTNTAAGGQHIRLRGIPDDSQFDWESYWNDNTYNKAVLAGPNLFDDVRSFSYACGSYTCNDTRRLVTDIQMGVNDAQAGDTVLVNEGTYVEQVVIGKSLTVQGEDGKAVTFITAPATIPVSSNPDSTIVKIAGAGVQVELFGFTVNGPGPSGCGSILAGIFVRDGAYANIHDNNIEDIRDTGDSGCQNGHGILVGRSTLATSATADIKDNVIDDYQKTGIIVQYTGSHADIEGNQVLGDGPKTIIAENGIQVSGGATAEIKGNTISGHSYTPFSFVSVGVLLFGPATINTDGNTLSENQVGIYIIDADGTHKNNTIGATAAGTGSPGFWGIIVDAPPPHRVPDGFEAAAAAAGAQSVGPNSPAADQTVVLTGNNLTSNGSAGGVGLEADAGFGMFDIDLTATKNLIHNWQYGVYVYECDPGVYTCTGTDFAKVAINRNSIVGNTDYGMYASTLTPVTNGECNWWGAANGPSDQGPGSGDAVGVDIDFDPWLGSSNLDGPCPAPADVCPAPDASPLWTDILGKGMGSPKKHKSALKLTIPNYADVDSLYGQLVAKATGQANYVRFILPGKNNYVQVNAITSPADHPAGTFWYGDYLPPSRYVTGRWFLQKSGTKNHIPRAFVLYPTYSDTDDTYVNIWHTYDAAEGEVYWDTAAGWTQTRVINEPIAPPNGPTTFIVELAVVDNDKDARPVWVTVEAGGVSQTQMPNNPNAGDQLNLMTFTLADVPAGTDEITITVYSPSLAADGVVGDSATLVGMAARYVCGPLE